MKRKFSSMGRVAIALVLAVSLMLVMAVPVAAADAVINIPAIPGVTAPVVGENVVTEITETAQYTGAVTWTPAEDPFLGETVYTAVIILTAKTGYTLTGVAANSFTVAGATATNPADSGVVTAIFPATAAAAAIISIAAIPGVTIPAAGGTPVTAITATDEYTGTVTWSPDPAGSFAGDTVYTATIILTAEAGFTLTGVGANSFTVAGTTGSAANLADSGVVTAIFPATLDEAVIDIAVIPGVTVPVVGETPVSVITATAEYTGTVAWTPADGTFAGLTVYTATITLAASGGFTLTGVAENFFTVTGTTGSATNSADSGEVTAIFPITGAAVVTTQAIPGVTAPVIGGTPVSAITETAQYTGTVAWAASDDPFLGATVYTATITLAAKTGFTLTGVAEDFFTVDGATDTNPASSGVVTAIFTITDATATTIEAAFQTIPGVTAPGAGVIPVTAITATDQYTGIVTWSPADTPFAGVTVYTATITLTAKAGFTFTGVTENWFLVTGTTPTHDANSGVVTAIFSATGAAVVVTEAAIPGVTAPAIGVTPVTAITATAEYTGTVAWTPADGTFAGDTVYTATIILTAKTGYTLTGVTAGTFTVDGADLVANLDDSGVVTAIFPATADAATVVDILAIPGVTAPAVGGTPVAAITETAEYTGTVTWSPADDPFAGVTVYTATITLTAKAGFTFTGVLVDTFLVAGTTPTHDADSGVVEAIFPATAAAVIDIAAIAGVTPPEDGEGPVSIITETDQYTTGAVTWTPTGSFAEGTVYTAIIILTPKETFTLTGVAANFFTVAGATATNPAGSGVVTAVFPVTYDVLIDLNDIDSDDTDWTLVSTDQYILSSGDSTSAFIGSVSLIYKYVGTGYLSATVADLKPVEAIYVKTTGTDGQLGLKYSGGVPVASNKDLVEGWNLISSATSDDADDILSSLQYVEVGEQQGVGLATLVSQLIYNINTTPAWYIDATVWTNLASQAMNPFDGYWIYMNAAKSFGVIPQ